MLIAAVVVGAALHQLESALLPFVVALFLSNIFRPLVSYLRSKKVPMVVAILLVLVLVGGVLIGVGFIGLSSVKSLIAAMPRYEAKWNHTILPGILHLIDNAPAEIQQQVKDLQWTNIIDVSMILGAVSVGAGTFVTLMSRLVLILLFMLFILAGNGMFARKVESAYHAKSAGRIGFILSEVEKKIRRYLITVTTINAVSGVLTVVILSIFGVDLALLWGLLTFLVNFIPTIGSIIAVVLPISVAFLQFDTVGTPITVAIILIVTQFLLGSVITPKVMGSSLNLSPLLVLISLIIWGWIWGPWGMILSVPITSTIKILLENLEGMSPIAILMGSGPGATSPPPDPDEAIIMTKL